MHPWITARLLDQRRQHLAAGPRPHPRRRAPHARWPRRLRGWLDRVVPAEAGPVRLRARQPLA